MPEMKVPIIFSKLLSVETARPNPWWISRVTKPWRAERSARTAWMASSSVLCMPWRIVRDRYAGVCSGVELSIPVENPEDEERLADTVREIQGG